MAPVKRNFIISLLLLLIAANVNAKEKTSSLVLNRMFSFQEKYNPKVKGQSMQVYTKHYYQTYRRNFALWLIPNMHSMANGQRKFMSEEYDLYTIKNSHEYDVRQQVYYTTIPRNRKVMSVLDNFARPNLYSPTLYGNHILSPVCRENRLFYRYKVTMQRNGRARVDFRPRAGDNTQLVEGTAILIAKTGRIVDIVIKGEYDMIDFKTTYNERYNEKDSMASPRSCKTDIDFKFLGNNIASSFTSVFNCPKRLPDTTDVTGDRKLISALRPISLTREERKVYKQFDSLMNVKTDTVPHTEAEKNSALKALGDFGWDVGGELLSSHGTTNDKYKIRLSPIIEPQYFSYSPSRGLSYKMRFAAEYYFDKNTGLYFNPTLGYNFKIKKFFAYMPLRYIYDKKQDNYLELSLEAGNRIGNSSVLDELKNELGELPELENITLDEFDDYQARIINSTKLNSWLRGDIGLVYHRRTAVNKDDMEKYGKPTVYRSVAPTIGVHLSPWKEGPSLSVNYERGIDHKDLDLSYERWEASASKVFRLPSTRMINLQVGGGLYTKRSKNYFMDFANFSMNNLPGGWDDDWSGDFQLLDSRLYNMSHYYLSSNICYDTPLSAMSLIPLLGRYVERERFYWSGLLIEYSRPYQELGYGFSTRFFSVGLFASFHNLEFQKIGTKFTFELFRRW